MRRRLMAELALAAQDAEAATVAIQDMLKHADDAIAAWLDALAGVMRGSQVLGFTLKGLDTDEHGIRPHHFEDMCANERIRALVCTPNLNNPTVALMADSRRRAN